MSLQNKEIDIEDAVAGMVLADAVVDSHGGVLLPGATPLTDAMIASLQRRGIDRIYIVNNDVSEADLEAERERVRKRLAVLFRQCGDSRACGTLLQRIVGYRIGEAG